MQMKLLLILERIFDTTSYGNRTCGTTVTLSESDYERLGFPRMIDLSIEPYYGGETEWDTQSP